MAPRAKVQFEFFRRFDEAEQARAVRPDIPMDVIEGALWVRGVTYPDERSNKTEFWLGKKIVEKRNIIVGADVARHERGFYPKPENVVIRDLGNRPDYSNEIARAEFKDELLGNKRAFVYRSFNAELEYILFQAPTGHVWIASVTSLEAMNTSFGIPSIGVNAEPLTSPLYDYVEQVPFQYAGERHHLKHQYCLFWNYISRMPEIPRWYAESTAGRDLPMPALGAAL